VTDVTLTALLFERIKKETTERGRRLHDQRWLDLMTQRAFSHYVVTVTAGPGLNLVAVDVTYYDMHNQEIGHWSDDGMAFGYTWKDVSRIVTEGLRQMRTDALVLMDPSHPSPHCDLT
jgi:hypothetical protein